MTSKQLTLGYVPYGTGQVQPFDTIFQGSKEVSPEDILNGDVDCLVIWGGEDISPTIYNEPVELHTGATEFLSRRDHIEVNVCKAAIKKGIPILGICRGAQLLCALAGGKLIQHVDNHVGAHRITCSDGQTRITSSVHHQMMQPWDTKYELIAYDARPESGVGVEPEIVYFPDIKGLAIQGHPEFMSPSHEFVTYSRQLVKQYLLGE